jgi:integrase
MRRVPRYCVHKAKNLAYVTINGQERYLGRAHSPESYNAFHEALAALAQGRQPPQRHPRSRSALTIAELAEAHLRHCIERYGPKHQSTYQARYVARELIRSHATAHVAEFGPRAFKAIRDRLQADGHSRQWANRLMNAIRSCIRWAVSEELAPPDRLQALECVAGLRYGEAREAPPRTAADPVAVQTCIRHLQSTGQQGAAGILRFIRATGCRPAEAACARWQDLTLDDCPTYRPRQHKTARHGIERVIPLNADALSAIRSVMRLRTADGMVFTNTNGKAFTPNAILLAVNRSIAATGCVKWSPYGLRHLAATAALAKTGSEAAAAALLGHSPRSTIIQRYSRDRLVLATRAAKAIEEVA